MLFFVLLLVEAMAKKWRFGQTVPILVADVYTKTDKPELPIGTIEFTFLFDQTTSMAAYMNNRCTMCEFESEFVPRKNNVVILKDNGKNVVFKYTTSESQGTIDETNCKYDCFECVVTEFHDDL